MAQPDPTSHRDPSVAPTPGAGELERAAGARRPLSCDRIVDAAVRYVDHDCLDGLSMRRLGAELGVEAMSLYRYFPSKAALLDAVVCRLLAEVALPSDPADADWEAAVRAYAGSFRAVCVAHPRLLPLLATLGPANPTLVDIEERMGALWRAAGLPGEQGGHAQTALQGYLTGSCLQGAGTDAADAAFRLGLDALLVGLRHAMKAEARRGTHHEDAPGPEGMARA